VRWRFPDSKDDVERQARAAVEHRIAAFWRAFESTAPRIDALFSRRAQWDLPSWMHQHIDAIDPALMWEFGPGLRGGHRLVITPEGDHHLRPFVSAILARAPALAGWEFYPHRLAEPLDQALSSIEGRTGVDFGGFRASVKATDDGGVDLVFWSMVFAQLDPDVARRAAFVAAESLLGEDILDAFVDVIDAAAAPADGDRVELGALASAVAAKVESSRARLSPAPVLERSELGGTIWKLRPAEKSDYSHQHDLFVGKSALPEMWTRAHSNRIFSSARFSRFGETFCYVKIDGSQGLDKEGFADKAEIEDALDAALMPAGLGAQVGGGTGLRYSYVDLALRDVDKAIPLIRKILRGGRVPLRSWLLFFDAALRDEWVGIWDETPAPP
jgi:hypothetical protein